MLPFSVHVVLELEALGIDSDICRLDEVAAAHHPAGDDRRPLLLEDLQSIDDISPGELVVAATRHLADDVEQLRVVRGRCQRKQRLVW